MFLQLRWREYFQVIKKSNTKLQISDFSIDIQYDWFFLDLSDPGINAYSNYIQKNQK